MRQGEYDVEVRNFEEFPFARCEPALARLCLTLRAMPVPAGNGDLPITCIMGSNSLWRVERASG
jgi:hypothetical protein